jgi:hypothetical protein
MTTCDKNIVTEVVGETRSKCQKKKETWWCDEKIQKVITNKKK